MTIPGTDGQKMSKSYGNTIDIFQPEKALKKNVMQIITDSKELEEPKNPDEDNIFALYSLIANEVQTKTMRANYEGGNYGYGHAKLALYELILEKYSKERGVFNYYMNNLEELNKKLEAGEKKASIVARDVLKRAKDAIGFSRFS